MFCLLYVTRCHQHRQTQHLSRILRKNHTVVPQPGRRKVATWLAVVPINNLIFHLGLLFSRKFLALSLELGRLDLGQHSRSLLASHNCYFGIGPHIEHSWVVGTTAHTIISSSIWSTNNTGNFRYSSCWDCIDHLGSMFGNPLMFVFLSNHKPSDVLEENQRHVPLRTYLYKVGSLLRRLTEKNTIIRHNTHSLTVQFSKTSHQCISILLFVLLKFWSVQKPSKDSPWIECFLEVRWNNRI